MLTFLKNPIIGVPMNKKTGKRRVFSFLWNGVVHLDDGSEWHLADLGSRHDVTWWQTGEAVEIEGNRGTLILRNRLRGEAVAIVPALLGVVDLAA